MKNGPVFIHSLFRSGSTYIFKKLRGLDGLQCFQESVHELAFYARNSAEVLIIQDEGEMQSRLRHPRLEVGYFSELQKLWADWRNLIQENSIYEDYFWTSNQDAVSDYLRLLIEKSNGRAVFQECRTACRIGRLKALLGGYHVYLWRNPWDQWWSYKVGEYFDAANQVIIGSKNVPQEIVKLRGLVGFTPADVDGIEKKFEFYVAHPLSASKSYLLFYVLWCLGLREGLRHADMMLSIDCLSVDAKYRDQIVQMFGVLSIPNISFEDCAVPRSMYLEKDRDFFEREERIAHSLLLQCGWAESELEQLKYIRESSACESFEIHKGQLARLAQISRMLVISNQDKLHELSDVSRRNQRHVQHLVDLLASKEERLIEINTAYQSLSEHSQLCSLQLQQSSQSYAALQSSLQQKDEDILSLQKYLQLKERALQDSARSYNILREEVERKNSDIDSLKKYLQGKELVLQESSKSYVALKSAIERKDMDLVKLQKYVQDKDQALLAATHSYELLQSALSHKDAALADAAMARREIESVLDDKLQELRALQASLSIPR